MTAPTPMTLSELKAYTPSPYQQAIFDTITAIVEKRSKVIYIVVEAVAGSGKTFTIVRAAYDYIPLGETILFCTFIKELSKELSEKVEPDPEKGKPGRENATVMNVHRIGRAALADHLGNDLWVGEKRPNASGNVKKWRLAERYISEKHPGLVKPSSKSDRIWLTDDGRMVKDAICDLYGFVRLTLTDPNDREAVIAIARHYGVEFDDRSIAAIPTIMQWGEQQAIDEHIIDFDDMIYLPVKWDLPMTQYDWVMVDEAQDLNRAQLELSMKCRKPDGHMVFVGDRCQPAGTMVHVVKTNGNKWHKADVQQIPIEELQEGDQVVTYSPRECSFEMRGRNVNGITRKPYDGDLIKVTTEEGYESRYTTGHHCYASFETLRDRYAIYMMQRGPQFRIGKAKMDYKTSSGPIARARAENADALWILDTYPTEQQAQMWEASIAGKFGLPQLTFNVPGGDDARKQTDLDECWEFIGDNTSNALKCLQYFGRNFAYPIFSPSEHDYRSFKRPMVVRACNLLDGAIMLPFKNAAHTSKANWLTITVEREYYKGFVYSLDVDTNHLFVADNLTTHNCQAIMGFAGADNRSLENIIERTQAEVLPLSICYRCPTSVITKAQEIIPHIKAKEGAVVGEIIVIPADKLHEHAKPRDMIICRLKAPLVSQCIEFIKQGKAAKVKGKDIGAQLTKIVDKVAKREHFTFELFLEHLFEYRRQQVNMMEQREVDSTMIESFTDSCLAVEACYDNYHDECETTKELNIKINALFDDKNAPIQLATIHKSKGLEADNVFILAPDKLPLDCDGWQMIQEWNLLYVAVTRAKKRLVSVGGPLRSGPHAQNGTQNAPLPEMCPTTADVPNLVTKGSTDSPSAQIAEHVSVRLDQIAADIEREEAQELLDQIKQAQGLLDPNMPDLAKNDLLNELTEVADWGDSDIPNGWSKRDRERAELKRLFERKPETRRQREQRAIDDARKQYPDLLEDEAINAVSEKRVQDAQKGTQERRGPKHDVNPAGSSGGIKTRAMLTQRRMFEPIEKTDAHPDIKEAIAEDNDHMLTDSDAALLDQLNNLPDIAPPAKSTSPLDEIEKKIAALKDLGYKQDALEALEVLRDIFG